MPVTADQGYAVVRDAAQMRLFSRKPPLLDHLDLELTERCDNNCIHCYINRPASDGHAKSRELTTQKWQDLLRQAADLGALWVRFTGGEPLLRPDFAEIYLSARRLGLRVVLFTNGRLLTPQVADLLARVPPLMKVEVSVYGMGSASYDAVARTPGAFYEFRRGLALLQARGIPFIVKSVLLPPNRAEIEEFESWAATLPGMDHPPTYAVHLDLRTRRDSSAKNRCIARLRLSPAETVALAGRPGARARSEMRGFAGKFMGPQGDRLFACGSGEAGCVDAYGMYQMCMLLRHPDLVCDVKRNGLRMALVEVFPRLREARASNPAYLERCARCFLKGLCEQCPGKSWSEHGTLDTPVEYLCDVAHAQARSLGILAAHESAWQVVDWRERVGRLVGREREDAGLGQADASGVDQ